MKALLAIAVLSLSLPSARSATTETPAGVGKAKQRRKPTKIKREPAKAAGPLRPVNITSKLFEISPTSQTAVWRGEVVVERDDVKVTCDELTAEFDEAKQVRTVTCRGNAHMIQRAAAATERREREAWGEVAVFDNERSLLTVTGSPRAREGDSTMKGSKVVFLVDEDRVLVEDAVMVVETAKAGQTLGGASGGEKR